MKECHYLIAGGAGFIGSHLSEMLIKKGHRVSVIDNLSTGVKQNIEHLIDRDGFTFYRADITETIDFSISPDTIVHMAAIANPTDYEKKPVCSLSVNSEGNRNLLELAEKQDSRYLFFSSSEIYGDHNPPPEFGLKEDMQSKTLLGHKRSPYFVGKMYGEELVKNFCEGYAIEYLIVRPFNIYGPRMDRNSRYGRVIPNFIERGLKEKPLLINGNGTQVRSFCFVSDVIGCLSEIFKKDHWAHDVVNIGNPDPVSIKELAEKINEITGNPSDHEFKDRFKHEPDYRMPNIDLVKNWTDWTPTVSLNDGIEKTIEKDDILGEAK